MAERVLGCCAVALLLHLNWVSAAHRLNDITDLKSIQFGRSVPRHSLQLLHWFANQVDLNHEILLGFDPNSDYGTHHYGNSDGLLPLPPFGHRYYTVGNLYVAGAQQLPDYVRHQQQDNDGYNRARIIFSAYRGTINRVYLTQQYSTRQWSSYDPNHTHEISPYLLRELRQLSRDRLDEFYTDNYQMQSLRRNSAHHTFQGTDSILDIVKWAFILIVVMALFIIINALDGKSPHRN